VTVKHDKTRTLLLLVERERDALRIDNCRLRDKLREIAKKCKTCHGNGLIEKSWKLKSLLVAHQAPCPDCMDLRELLQ
jgi:hypothetical protein